MSDTDQPKDSASADLPPVGEPAVPQRDGPMGSIRGTDAAALGTDQPQRLDPPQADVDPSSDPVPRRDEVPRTDERPWMTTLAATGADAGVQSDVEDPDAHEGRATPD